jgi:hypothetical protein
MLIRGRKARVNLTFLTSSVYPHNPCEDSPEHVSPNGTYSCGELSILLCVAGQTLLMYIMFGLVVSLPHLTRTYLSVQACSFFVVSLPHLTCTYLSVQTSNTRSPTERSRFRVSCFPAHTGFTIFMLVGNLSL